MQTENRINLTEIRMNISHEKCDAAFDGTDCPAWRCSIWSPLKSDVSLCSLGFVTSRRAAQPTEEEERRCQQASALLAASTEPGCVPGREQRVYPLWRHRRLTGHVWLPPSYGCRLPHPCQASQRPAASDTGGDAREEKGVTVLRAVVRQRVHLERHVLPGVREGDLVQGVTLLQT